MMTPDGDLLVELFKIKHTVLGFTHRGKMPRYHATGYFRLTHDDGAMEREGHTELWPEHLNQLTAAGYNFDWPNGDEEVVFDPPIPVILDKDRKLVDVQHVEKA